MKRLFVLLAVALTALGFQARAASNVARMAYGDYLSTQVTRPLRGLPE